MIIKSRDFLLYNVYREERVFPVHADNLTDIEIELCSLCFACIINVRELSNVSTLRSLIEANVKICYK